MIPKLLLCTTGLYVYAVLVFLQMSWIFYHRNASNVKLPNVESFENGIKKESGTLYKLNTHTERVIPNEDITKAFDTGNRCTPISQRQGRLNSCANFTATGDKSTLLRTKERNGHANEYIKEIQDCNLDHLVKNCTMLKKVHEYNSIPVSPEERNFPLAFTIKIHNHPDEAERILRTIYRTHNIYCIHVDQKAQKQVFDVIDELGKCFDNVIVLQDREKMFYSSYAHVMAELKCMKVLSQTNVPWKYYINLSGQEFPLKTNMEMVAILELLDGTNDIETYDHPVYENWKFENRFTLQANGLAQDSKKQKFKYKMKFSKGNPLGLFSREFVEFILVDDIASEVLNYFNDTYAPEENIWPTLVTLPWAPGGYPVEVRHMISTYVSRAMILSGDTPKCHGRIFRSICHFACGDLSWLKSRPEFFAHKFDPNSDRSVLDCLETWYRNKAFNPHVYNIDWAFYSRLPHVRHQRKHRHYVSSNKEDIKKEWIANSQVL